MSTIHTRTGTKCVCMIPRGWSVRFYAGSDALSPTVIAVKAGEPPRYTTMGDPMQPFKEWERFAS